jgi:hypothetical protein
VAAAIALAEFHELPDIWLLGWSFGTDLALRYGRDSTLTGVILLLLDEVVRRVNPAVEVPLPTTWEGLAKCGDPTGYVGRAVSAFADVPVPGPAWRKAAD